jgi:F-type H+-transporting ATPase subunit b
MTGIGMIPFWMMHVATEVAELEPSLPEASGLSVPQILESNLINIVIILVLLIYVSRNVVGEILAQRRSGILQELEAVEKQKKAALETLAIQQQNLAQAQQEAERIKQQAEANAQKVRTDLLEQVERDIVRLRETAEKEVSSEQQRIIEELRLQIVRQALAKAESDLPQHLDPSRQSRLIDYAIQQLA